MMEEILKLYHELHSLFGENDLAAEFSQRVHRIIQETIDRIPDETRIAIRPAGTETRGMLGLFDFSKKNIVGILDQKNRGDNFCGYPCFVMDSFPSKACDCVIINSFSFRREIKEDLEARHIPYIDFYDEMEKRGIQPPPHFYDGSVLAVHTIVNHFYLRYLRAEAGPQREAALRELLQTAVECKDFIFISNIYQNCGGENGEFPLLKTVWEKSEYLLDRIRDKLRERKQKDIILFWTDGVPYDMLHHLPGTMELSKQGAFFQRASTHTPYTNPTFNAMFFKMLPIDDFPQNQEKIDGGNSPLIRFMEKEGYKVRFVGVPQRCIEMEYVIDTHLTRSCNIVWWRGILDLLQSPEPCFYLFQFLECHDRCVPDQKQRLPPEGIPRQQWEAQIKAVYGYLDQCLLLYHKLLGNKTQIFFSDHGVHLPDEENWSELTLHPYCFVVGENIPKITVTRFFPYKNFDKFLRWLADPAHSSLDDVCEDEVIFQDTDYYSEKLIARHIRNNTPKKGLAYRGILNYDYKYVINALGEEFFYRRQQDGTEKLVPLEDPALRTELQNKAGTRFLGIDRFDKFRHTKKLYEYLRSKEGEAAAVLEEDGR